MGLELFEQMAVGVLGCNCYIVGDPETRDAIVIDPGGDTARILEAVERQGLKVVAQVATHAHFDHVLAADEIRAATGAPFMLHESDVPLLDWIGPSMQMFLGVEGETAPEVDRRLTDSDEIAVGQGHLVVIHTPGHSPGSMSLLIADTALFSGDTLFADSIGRTDLPGGDFTQLETAVQQRIFPLGDLPVYPGHGPATTIDRERVGNPFVGMGRKL